MPSSAAGLSGLNPSALVRRAADFGVERFADEISRFFDGVLARARITAPRAPREPSHAYMVQ